MKIPLQAIRNCFEGLAPSTIASCAPDGTPNVTYLSHINFIDGEHVALSFQFFNKTRQNVAVNPYVAVLVVDPESFRQYTLDLFFERTETSGPLFEQMRVKLDSIASLTRMTGVFHLRGADIYRVLECQALDGNVGQHSPAAPLPSGAVRNVTAEIAACEDLATLLDATLKGLSRHLGYGHSMLLLRDPGRKTLFTVASHGYPASGAGAEVALGNGVIGVAAEQRQSIRVTHMTHEIIYGRAVRQRVADTGGELSVEHEIKLPGLAEVESALAVPIVAQKDLVGVLYLESAHEGRFLEQDEAALVTIADHLGTAILLCSHAADYAPSPIEPLASRAPPKGPPLLIRRYEADDSIFVGDDYLIKGVAGAILWKLLTDYSTEGRTEFSNRELRLDPTIKLPAISDNLEARLVLLLRRLKDRHHPIRIKKVARGRFHLDVDRPLELRSIKPL
jgi:adenylate cyclase